MQKFLVSRDDTIYQAWPDVALTPSGKLVCVFSECTHHGNRAYTRIVLVESTDRGRTWSAKRPVTEALHKTKVDEPHWNCARIVALADGRLCVCVDRVSGANEGNGPAGEQSNWLYFSSDEGATWTGPHPTPVRGIVPDRLIELKTGAHAGRWLLSAHTVLDGVWHQRVWHTDDLGETWSGPVTVAADPRYKLCEGSLFELPGGEICCLLRENSGQGLDAFKTVSHDGGLTWEPLCTIALPGCHRPVGGMLQSGHAFVSYRFMQGGNQINSWLGWWTQNFFVALLEKDTCLAKSRDESRSRIYPVDFDRSPVSDIGYSGWVQFPDGEIYVVYYIVDDAPKAQIRGCSLRESDLILE